MEPVEDTPPSFEERLWASGFSQIAGADEAGRGALAGPLVGAAVILDRLVIIEDIKDSKLLTPPARERLYERITESALAWSVVRIEHDEIDDKGLQWANLTALERAVDSLNPGPDFVLSDAFSLKSIEISRLAVIKGDRLSISIAAASILAKVTRDRIMIEYHEEYPAYGFDEHKGYSTPLHKSRVKQHGPCPIHRKSFAPVSGHGKQKVESRR